MTNTNDGQGWIWYQSTDLIEFYLAQVFSQLAQLSERILGHNITRNPILLVSDQLEANSRDTTGWICYQSIELIEFCLAQVFAKVAQLWEPNVRPDFQPKPLFY